MTRYGQFDSDAVALKERAALNSDREQKNLEAWFLECVKPQPHWKVLELGCGLGKQTFAIAPHVDQVVAVDISRDAVDTVNYYARDGRLNVQAYQASFDDQHVHMNGMYDLIFSVYAIYYASDMIGLLKRMRYHLKDFGRVFVAVPGAGSNEEIKALEERATGKPIARVKDFISPVQLDDLWHEYSTVEVTRLDNKIVFHSRDEVMRWWRNHNSYHKECDQLVEAELHQHFRGASEFAVSKNVMGVTLKR